MKAPIFICLNLLCNYFAFSQRAVVRPIEIPRPSEIRQTESQEILKLDRNASSRNARLRTARLRTASDYTTNELSYISTKRKIAEDKIIWEIHRERLPNEFEKLKSNNNDYIIDSEGGKFDIYHCGENVTSKFIITDNNDVVSIRPINETVIKNINFYASSNFYTSGKKVISKSANFKLIVKDNEVYNIREVTINNKGSYFIELPEGILVNPTSDMQTINHNLNRKFTKEQIKVISLVDDPMTNKRLSYNFNSNFINCKSKAELFDFINSQEKGNTIMILGHHENGRIIAEDSNFELTAKELYDLKNKNQVNLFPLGCKTAFSDFNEGANINLNSREVTEILINSIKPTNNFKVLLHDFTKSKPDLKLLINENTFGYIKLEVIKSPFKPIANLDTINRDKIAVGYIFTTTYEAENHKHPDWFLFGIIGIIFQAIINKYKWSIRKYIKYEVISLTLKILSCFYIINFFLAFVYSCT